MSVITMVVIGQECLKQLSINKKMRDYMMIIKFMTCVKLRCLLLVLGLLLVGSCAPINFFPSRDYYGDKKFRFSSDNSFEYFDWVADGYVYAFSKGSWKQEGKSIFLFNKSNPKELPIEIRKDTSNNPALQLIVNLFPKKKFDYLPSSIDLVNVELVIDNEIHQIISETRIIELHGPFKKGYLKLYPKRGADIAVKILNDTLYSKDFSIAETNNATVSIDVDCNPYYFALVKMPNDTLRIINDRKIRWRKAFLERPH